MKLLTVFFALVLVATTAVAQQKIIWEGQKMVFILDGEGEITQDDEKNFKIENQQTFFAAEIIEEADAAKIDAYVLISKIIEARALVLASKGGVIKTEQGAKGYYVVAQKEKMLIAFCLMTMSDSKFPILFSFPIEKDASELVTKMLNGVHKM